ncbi:unnamed protein product [Psylliodes chrysocephalus]|uniref:PIG-P domain-containing protein n=1 Tax=Psylliodes chrysocephalus TaxID=3402493 RepID=A0A9P0CZ91_9CUCU|nr:unnamed protein product [Psylliodes chrysocephala]
MPEHTPSPTPSRAVYGFVMYLSFRIFFIIYLIWAVVPETYFKTIGITFLPQRCWALTIPIYLLTVMTFVAFIIYPGLGLTMTPHIDDLRTIRDKIGEKRRKNGLNLGKPEISQRNCVCKNKQNCSRDIYLKIEHTFVNNRIPVLEDIEIWNVSDHLHLD